MIFVFKRWWKAERERFLFLLSAYDFKLCSHFFKFIWTSTLSRSQPNFIHYFYWPFPLFFIFFYLVLRKTSITHIHQTNFCCFKKSSKINQKWRHFVIPLLLLRLHSTVILASKLMTNLLSKTKSLVFGKYLFNFFSEKF